MRFVLFFAFLLCQAFVLNAQTSLADIALEPGTYKVGFRHIKTFDQARAYSRVYDYTNKKIPRPIPMSVWYPAPEYAGTGETLTVLDYMEILKEEEEWEHLPNEQILNWFYYANTPANQKHLDEPTTAYKGIASAQGKFPLIVYAPSFQASSIENFALCETLASHGYVVVSSPSRGTETRWFSDNNAKEMETQARDMEFLIREARSFPMVDADKVALMGFSFGGLSNMVVQNRNDLVKAIVSLDGTERYQYKLLKQSPFFEVQNVDIPYLHLAQKDIPKSVLKEDKIDPKLNTAFPLYDSLTNSKAYRLKFHNLTHSHFSTLGVLFAKRDPRQDKSDPEIMESYRWVVTYALNFLDATLQDKEAAMSFIEGSPVKNGIANGLITRKIKRPKKKEFTFQDFNDLATLQGYKDLFELYNSVREEHPSFEIPEGHLNTLGLQFVFNPKTSSQGIQVFLLATKLYPKSANLYDSLAEGYLFLGKTEKAIESFERSLDLNPQNQNAINRLAQLKE